MAGFAPATIAPEAGEAGGCGRIEIVSANGLRFLVDGAVDVAALARIMRGLDALP